MALLVDEQLALDALEALPAEPPDPVVTVRTESFPVKPFCLQHLWLQVCDMLSLRVTEQDTMAQFNNSR